MKKWLAAICAICLVGCTTKTRNLELDGMCVSKAGMLAIGSVDAMAAPIGEETATIRYEEDTSWLNGIKTHEIKVMLTGTNSVPLAHSIVKEICEAFTSTSTNRTEVMK